MPDPALVLKLSKWFKGCTNHVTDMIPFGALRGMVISATLSPMQSIAWAKSVTGAKDALANDTVASHGSCWNKLPARQFVSREVGAEILTESRYFHQRRSKQLADSGKAEDQEGRATA